MAMDLEQVERDGAPVIRVTGEVDLYSSPKLREALLKAIPKAVEEVGIDLSGVTYMDSSGVATLVEGLKASGQKNARFVLVTPSQAVMKVLQLSRLDSVFDIREAD